MFSFFLCSVLGVIIDHRGLCNWFSNHRKHTVTAQLVSRCQRPNGSAFGRASEADVWGLSGRCQGYLGLREGAARPDTPLLGIRANPSRSHDFNLSQFLVTADSELNSQPFYLDAPERRHFHPPPQGSQNYDNQQREGKRGSPCTQTRPFSICSLSDSLLGSLVGFCAPGGPRPPEAPGQS